MPLLWRRYAKQVHQCVSHNQDISGTIGILLRRPPYEPLCIYSVPSEYRQVIMCRIEIGVIIINYELIVSLSGLRALGFGHCRLLCASGTTHKIHSGINCARR